MERMFTGMMAKVTQVTSSEMTNQKGAMSSPAVVSVSKGNTLMDNQTSVMGSPAVCLC